MCIPVCIGVACAMGYTGKVDDDLQEWDVSFYHVDLRTELRSSGDFIS